MDSLGTTLQSLLASRGISLSLVDCELLLMRWSRPFLEDYSFADIAESREVQQELVLYTAIHVRIKNGVVNWESPR